MSDFHDSEVRTGSRAILMFRSGYINLKDQNFPFDTVKKGLDCLAFLANCTSEILDDS